MGDRSVLVKDLPTDREGSVVEITVFHQKGGHNWFHGTTETGGFYVSAQVVRIEKGHGYTSRLYAMGKGRKVKIEDAERFNAKKLAKIVETVRAALDAGTPIPSVSGMILAVAAADGVTLA